MPTRPQPWDSLAGVHLVREAGGMATDVYGDRWHVDSEGLVVSNGNAHDRLLETIQDGIGLEV
ncbi:inositol monophosphatase family protein [Halovenus salina]|uniref:Inositol monophosphatase family protein n=2 Tax=Halovenus salina TaxID=1510225 RepID=A0ABD5VWH3_9EURY